MPEIMCTSLPNAASEDVWNDDLIAQAQPEFIDPADIAVDESLESATVEGPAESHFMPSGDGDDSSVAEAEADTPETQFGLPTVVPNPPYHYRPYWNCGKIVYKNASGQRFSCTAAFVANPNVLMTAAHCVIDPKTGRWNSNFRFLRGITYGSYGQVVIPKTVCIYKEAISNRTINPLYDYAFMSTKQRSGAGWLGFATNETFPNPNAVYSLGYPSCIGGDPRVPTCEPPGRVPEKPQNMYYDLGKLQTSEKSDQLVEMLENPMQRGISGGPWIRNFSSEYGGGQNNIAIGLNSLPGVGGSSSSVTGPRFDTNTYNLLMHVINSL